MTKPARRLYEFGPFRLDPSERLLLRDGQAVQITPKVFDTLIVLLERNGHLVEKDELMERLWPDTIVEEGALTRNISDLRKAIGEEKYIETVPKRGYRFVGPVREIGDEGATLTIEKVSRAHLVIEEEMEGERAGAWEYGSTRGKTLPLPTVVHTPKRPHARALIFLVTALLSGMATVASYHWISAKRVPTEPLGSVRTLAVLPFKPLTSDGGDQYLELGMADTLITRLSNLSEIVVRPTSAIRKYTDLQQDPIAAGRELAVDSVIEGSIHKLDDKLRVTVRLLRVADGKALWAYKCELQCKDLFEVQDSVSERLAAALMPRLTGEEKKLIIKHYTESTEAYQLYLRGRYFWNKRTKEGFEKAVEFFNQAIAIDPDYALAYDGLAGSYLLLAGTNVYKGGTIPRAKAAVRRTLEIDDTLAEAHATHGIILQNTDWDWAGAEREYKRAIELNPNYATAHHWYGEFLGLMGRFDEGMAEIKRALQIDPVSLIINTDAAKILYFSRNYDQAIEQCRKTLDMDPNFTQAHHWLAQSYAGKGQFEDAIADLQGLRSADDMLWIDADLGWLYGVSGKRNEAQRVLADMKKQARQRYVAPFLVAAVHMGLGEKDQAIEWLEKAYEEQSAYLIGLKVFPAFDSLRSDPRYAALLQRVGFPQ